MASTRSIRITRTAGTYGAEVLLDGTDIANGVDGLTVTMRAGQPASVELSIPVIDITELQDAEARVYLSPESHDALTALGWTAPAETGERATDGREPLPPHIAMQQYDYKGAPMWAWACWGDGSCEGWRDIDHYSEPSALRSIHRHLSENHAATKDDPDPETAP